MSQDAAPTTHEDIMIERLISREGDFAVIETLIHIVATYHKQAVIGCQPSATMLREAASLKTMPGPNTADRNAIPNTPNLARLSLSGNATLRRFLQRGYIGPPQADSRSNHARCDESPIPPIPL